MEEGGVCHSCIVACAAASLRGDAGRGCLVAQRAQFFMPRSGSSSCNTATRVSSPGIQITWLCRTCTRAEASTARWYPHLQLPPPAGHALPQKELHSCPSGWRPQLPAHCTCETLLLHGEQELCKSSSISFDCRRHCQRPVLFSAAGRAQGLRGSEDAAPHQEHASSLGNFVPSGPCSAR